MSSPYQTPPAEEPSGQDPYPAQDRPADPYGQPAGGHPAYPAQPYDSGYGAPAGDHPQGLLILLLGIGGLVLAGVLSPVAWVLGNRAMREIRASGVHPRNETMIVAGRVLGIVGTVLLALAVVLGVLAVAVFAVAAGGLG